MKASTTIKCHLSNSVFSETAARRRRMLALVAGLLAGTMAQAHLTYTGRDLGTHSGLTNSTSTITNQAVTGNYGWADAADGILGDSHRARAFRFHLENAALVSLSVTANPGATTNSLPGFTPAFSLYAGLAAVAPFPPSQTEMPSSADHDGTPASLAWRTWWVQQNLDPSATDESPTDGSWNALGDFSIGGDGDLAGEFAQLSSFGYRGSAASTESGGTASGSFALPPGDYTILVGGNDLANKTSDTALSPHGIAVTLAVEPAPTLSIATMVFVSWPEETADNWVLQSAASPDADTWLNVTNTPVIVDGRFGVVLDPAASGQYFRFDHVP